MTKRLPAFELQGTRDSLASLRAISGYSIEPVAKLVSAVWLKSKDGTVRRMSVTSHDAMRMFEVFTLWLVPLEELEAQWEAWKPPVIPADAPEILRALMGTRPTKPNPPTQFTPWPFREWRTQVLRRAEFIVDNVPVGTTFGSNPNLQSAARPASVPKGASVSREVAAGVLFSGADGKRLLIGVDWAPMFMVVTDDAEKIEDYLKPCELVDLADYLDRIFDAA